MTIPTRIIEDDEYDRLLRLEEGDIIMIHQLDSIHFNPPTKDRIETSSVESEHIHIQYLFANEPCIYRDKDSNMIIVVLPHFMPVDYKALEDIHPDKGAWGYRLSPHGWDLADPAYHDLEWSAWFFPEEIEEYKREDVMTH